VKEHEKKIAQGERERARAASGTAAPPRARLPPPAGKIRARTAMKTAKQDAKAAAQAAIDASQGLQQVDLSALEGKTPEIAEIMGKTWTKETLEARVREELASRGRRGTDVRTVASRLAALAEISHRFGPRVSIPTMLHAVAARFDTSRGLDAFLERVAWKRSLRDLAAILAILEANPQLRLAPRAVRGHGPGHARTPGRGRGDWRDRRRRGRRSWTLQPPPWPRSPRTRTRTSCASWETSQSCSTACTTVHQVTVRVM